MQQLHSSACNHSKGRGMLQQLGRHCGCYWRTLLRCVAHIFGSYSDGRTAALVLRPHVCALVEAVV
jgi:hypothetical protein